MPMVETDLVQADDNSAKIDCTTDIFLVMLKKFKSFFPNAFEWLENIRKAKVL